MQHRNLILIFLCMMFSEDITFVRAKNKETECSPNDVLTVMTMCQRERQKLSYASQSNNTAQLCKALQNYSDCMKPRVQGCQGPAKMAFDVITSKYTGEPYKCQLGMQSEMVVSNVSYKINQTSGSKVYHKNINIDSDVNTSSGLDDYDVMETNNDISKQSYPVNTSTEILTTGSINATPDKNTITTTTTQTLNVNTSYGYNSAVLAHQAVSTAIICIFITIQIWK